jgi:hypothetical protein
MGSHRHGPVHRLRPRRSIDMARCPVHRKSEISPTGQRVCGAEPANIPTEVPMKAADGSLFPQPMLTCLECSIRVASWKLIQNVLAWEKKHPRRIITAG